MSRPRRALRWPAAAPGPHPRPRDISASAAPESIEAPARPSCSPARVAPRLLERRRLERLRLASKRDAVMIRDAGNQDVIVVGGGVIGLAVPRRARPRGMSVTLLQREAGGGGAPRVAARPRPPRAAGELPGAGRPPRAARV